MQGNKPGSLELRVADSDLFLLVVDVATAQAQRFGYPHSRARQQAEQRRESRRCQTACSRQPPCGGDKCFDLRRRVDVRGEPTMRAAEGRPLRESGRGLPISEIAGEWPKDGDALGPSERVSPLCLLPRPAEYDGRC